MKKKIALMATSLVLVVAMAVGGTLAWLTDDTETVTNSFSVGSVTISLDEAQVNEYGVPADAEGNPVDYASAARVTANEYKLIPSHTYTKDPYVHVAQGSEPCYLYVKVVDGIAEIEDATTIADQMTTNGWKTLGGNIYYYDGIVDAGDAQVDKQVFANFKLKGDANVANYANATIAITAYAIQADGFADAQTAWNTGAPTEWK